MLPLTLSFASRLVFLAAVMSDEDAPKSFASVSSTRLAVGETVILLQPPLPLLGVSIAMERGCQQNDSLADGYTRSVFRSSCVFVNVSLSEALLSFESVLPGASPARKGAFL